MEAPETDRIRNLKGPSSFRGYRRLLSGKIVQFPTGISLPTDLSAAYGPDWENKFQLPATPVGIVDERNTVFLADAGDTGVAGLGAARDYLLVQRLDIKEIPELRLFIAWGNASVSHDRGTNRFSAIMRQVGEGFMRSGSDSIDDLGDGGGLGPMGMVMVAWCRSLLGPGVVTACEQVLYLNSSLERGGSCN